MSRIFIVGAGIVGSATGRALRAIGHQVSYVDADGGRRAALAEQGLDVAATLDLTGAPGSYLVVCLPTPAVEAGYDLSALRDGIRAIGRALATSAARHTVVIRSAVPPRTTEGMVRHLLERVSGKRAGHGFDLACHPEFLRPGHADHDAQWPVLTVVGSQDRRVAERVARDLAPFGGVHHVVGSAAAAELVKCVGTLQRGANAAFWQEISQVARRMDIDPDLVARALGEQPEPASPAELRDIDAFLGVASDAGLPMPLLSAAAAAMGHERQAPARRTVPRPAAGGAHLVLVSSTAPGSRP